MDYKTMLILLSVLLSISMIVLSINKFNVTYESIRVRVATTTSLYATGLLDYLADIFRERYNCNIILAFMPLGSGEALRRAENGDACLVLVHAPSLEKEYINKGVLTDGHIFAYNYFIIVGPKDDPANVSHSSSVIGAFRKIYLAGELGKVKFISRGDRSGTNVRELMIWGLTGLNPKGKPWYIETGSGMGKTLLVANEFNAYTLSDIGTFLKFKSEGRIPNLVILYSNDTELINIYSAYIVSTCSSIEKSVANDFIKFLISDAQELIAKYGTHEYGQPLFYPAKSRIEWLSKIWSMLANGQRWVLRLE